MARSPGFGSAPYYLFRPIKTRFRFGSVLSDLTSHHGTTRRFILQKARHHPLTGSDFFQAHGFRFSFTPLPRFFSPFPHGTRSLSLTLYILPWRMVPPASDKISRVPPYSGSRSCPPRTSLTRLSLSSAVLPCTFCCPFSHSITVLQPRISPVWAFSPFARRYSGNHCCFLFLRVLRCFSSPGSSPFSGMTAVGCRVPPFGYRRFFASLRLAVAFRCLARPSSVQCGQASSLRPSLLDLL